MTIKYDYVVIGSGFGGSVSALRLTEKGYKVLLVEKGKRRADDEYPEHNCNAKNYMWVPELGLDGAQQITFTNAVSVIHGIGYGGGSQVYANVHFIPDEDVFSLPSWSKIRNDWYPTLKPYYKLAQRMLGTAKSTHENVGDQMLKETAKTLGTEDSYQTVNTGVFFSDTEQCNVDPYFNGTGPDRNPCTLCAKCALGCPTSSKNTLAKNYLHFAEKNGMEVITDREVVRIAPIDVQDNADGKHGYEIVLEPSIGSKKSRTIIHCKGAVVSGGVLGTVPLLMNMQKDKTALPNISKLLGAEVRTNSETLTAVTGMNGDISEGVSISSFINIDDETNMEINRIHPDSDGSYKWLPFVPLITGEGFGRILKFITNSLIHPIATLKMLNPKGKAKNSLIMLIMQKKEAFVHFTWQRKWYRLFRKGITVSQKPGDEPLSVSFPSAEKATKIYAEKSGGKPASLSFEVILGTPLTAHIMSGVAIGNDASDGVVSTSGEVFGYKNLHVLDGSIIPGNLGVNPSLTITALSEYVMSQIPTNPSAKQRSEPIQFSDALPDMVSNMTTEEAAQLVKHY